MELSLTTIRSLKKISKSSKKKSEVKLRQKKIQSLKQSIQAGAYNVSAKDVADAILDESLPEDCEDFYL